MSLKGVRIGFAVTGSHCTLGEIVAEIRRLVDFGAVVTPIVSPSVRCMDTRFGEAVFWLEELRKETGIEPIKTITEAEPVGPEGVFDIMVIAPCTGNTLAKLANGITDTPVLMAAKAHLRNCRPLVIGISTNDGLSINARNIGLVLNMKNIYFIPFGQDSPNNKINSLVAHMHLIPETLSEALCGKQIQPVLREYA